MWPFQRTKRETPPKDTTDRLEALEKTMRRLEEEWTEVYHKFRVLQMRVAKQAQRLDQAPEREDTQPEESPSTEAPKGGLSPRQLEVQNRIMALRRRHNQ